MKQIYFPLLCLISFALPSHGNTDSSSNKPKVCYQTFHEKNDSKEEDSDNIKKRKYSALLTKHNLEFSLDDPWPDRVFIYTDGASRGNPGHSAFGLRVLNTEGKIIYEDKDYLGPDKTNNFAEYQGVIHALELAKQKKIKHLIIHSDSQLVIDQLNGKSEVKSSKLKPLYSQCKEILKAIPSYEFIHILRRENKGADALANQALNNQEDSDNIKKRKHPALLTKHDPKKKALLSLDDPLA